MRLVSPPRTLPLEPSVSPPPPASVRPGVEGLLSALSLGDQAAVVAPPTNLRARGQRGGRGSRRGRRDRRSVLRRDRGVSRALTLVLVGPPGAPSEVVVVVVAADGGLLLQVQDAVDGALQVLVQRVVRGAAAGEAGVVHVG